MSCRILSIATALFYWESSISSAKACPFCDTETAERVNVAIFNADFAYHAALLASPFSVLVGILYVIYHAPSRRSPPPSPRTNEAANESKEMP